MAGGGGNMKRFQYCTHSSGQVFFFCLRALQGHSGRSPIDLTLQDNVCQFRTLSSSTFIISDVQPVFTLHHKFRIDSGRTKIQAGKDRRYSSRP